MSVGQLDGILLTHEHGDHTAGLEVLCRKHEVPLFCTPLTQETLMSSFEKARPRWRIMQTGAAFQFQDLRIECFPVPHDAVDPVGFLIQDEDSRLGVLSDVGFITNLIRDRLKGVHTLFMEANYDGPLLEADTKRPWATKQRISGRHGHLSNEQAAELVQHLAHEHLQHVILGHLSEDCNCPNVARQKITAALHSAGVTSAQVHCANRHEPLPWLEVARRTHAVLAPPVAAPFPEVAPVEEALEPAPTPPPAPAPTPVPIPSVPVPLREEEDSGYQVMEQLGLWSSMRAAG
ncbi:MBL fold metallo-hydrolase [Verrucomicrobium spinosum]|uniref:MBL fold metallo-hydrolase n=1 Tax=Verrucomicrobium spinosum TaxID=2736 RepID=UPI00094612C0|nr:MBL fold metallo-hydrolase [Verrucomicrobium spinosum]